MAAPTRNFPGQYASRQSPRVLFPVDDYGCRAQRRCRRCTAELKDQLQTKLNNARIPSARDDAETSLINEAIRWIPLRVIERIKKFRTKLRVHLLSYPRILHQCDVKVVDARPDDGCAPRRAEADRRLALEAFRLEETIQRLFVAR